METAKAILQEGEVSKDQKWYWYADGKGHKIKVVNLENDENCPKNGTILVDAIKKKDFDRDRTINLTISCTKDKATGIYWGIPLGIDNVTNQIKWQPIDLKMLNIFDRSVESEAWKCAIVMRSPIVEGSPNAVYKTTFYRVHDKEKAATQEIKRIKDGRKAIDIAMGLYGEELVNMGRNLQIPVESTSIAILESEVLKRAEKDPKEFLRIWENPHREIITILNRAIETGVIENDSLLGYMFNGVTLGTNESQTIEYMVKHRDITASIDFKSKAKMSDTLKSMATVEKNIVSATDSDTEIALLRKKIADLEAINENMATNSIKSALLNEKEEATPETEELESLKKEAVSLGIKGAQFIKNVDKIPELKKKIEDAKMELEK